MRWIADRPWLECSTSSNCCLRCLFDVCVTDLMVEFIASHMMKNFPTELYTQVLFRCSMNITQLRLFECACCLYRDLQRLCSSAYGALQICLWYDMTTLCHWFSIDGVSNNYVDHLTTAAAVMSLLIFAICLYIQRVSYCCVVFVVFICLQLKTLLQQQLNNIVKLTCLWFSFVYNWRPYCNNSSTTLWN